jgi:peptidylprolyl isomerase
MSSFLSRLGASVARRVAIIIVIQLVAATLVAAQSGPAARDFSPPPDLAAPPPDATKSATGVASRVVVAGQSTEKPGPMDVVTVHYTGWASDGRMFDSSYARGNPSMFPLGRALPGWRECVQLMVVGETRRCWVPEDQAYKGAAGRPKGTVVFDIVLLDTRLSPTIPPPDVKSPPSDARRTATGLAFKVLRPGTGTKKPRDGDKVTVHYTGWTTDGKMFDSSVARGQAATFELGMDLIRGWNEGVPFMVEGERTRFWIPEALAYKGEAGKPRGMLVFDIDLIKIE